MTAEYILYRLVPNGARMDKLPVSPRTGQVCNAHDPAEWVEREQAEAARAFIPADGVALVINGHTPRFCIDVDHAITNGAAAPILTDLLAQFPDAYVEVSQSGQGAHIIGRYAGPAPEHRCKHAALGLELYTRDRFIALTGTGARGSMDADCSAPLARVAAQYFPPPPPAPAWDGRPDPSWTGPADDPAGDDAIIAMMLSARPGAAAVFGERATLRQLWEGDADALARAYPSPTGDAWDRSSADAALFAHLAFWTGRNPERMWRIAQRSALVREKWQREDYARATVLGACARCERVYQQRPAAPVRPPSPDGLLIPLGSLTARPRTLVWQVAGILERGVLAMLVGEPETGKSFIALDLALSVATGREWHGHRVNAGPVIYVAGEGHAGLARRARAWEVDRGVQIAGAPIHVSSRAVRMLAPSDVAELTTEIDALPAPPALIVIDTLARAFIGGDENSALDAGRFVGELDVLRERYNATVIVVHHVTKNTGRARGSSAFFGAVDVELRAVREDSAIVLRSGKTKDSAPFEPRAFALREVTLPPDWIDDAGEVLRSAVIVPGEMPPPPVSRTRKLGRNQAQALDMLVLLMQRGAPVTVAEWAAAAGSIVDSGTGGLSANRFNEARRSLEAGGLVRVAPDGTVFLPGQPDPRGAPQ